MLGLPSQTEIKKIIPKNTVFTKFALNTAARNIFDEDIKQMTLVNAVSDGNISVEAGKKIKGFYVMLVTMKKSDFNEKNIVLLSKLIEQNIVFVLEFEGKYKIAVYYSKLMQTAWLTPDAAVIRLEGLNLDSIWNNIIIQIGNIELEEGNTLDTQLDINEERAKIEKQIAMLEKKLRTEKQPKKKFEIAQQIKKLKDELEEI